MSSASPCRVPATSPPWSGPTTWLESCSGRSRADFPAPSQMPSGANMTTTVPHIVNRFIIDAEDGFDDVRVRYESLVPTADFAELVNVIGTGDYARVQQYTAEHAPNSFLNFWAL